MATNFFKDLSLDFIPHPVSGDVRPVVDDAAIKKSISNLIRTPKGSRPFNPNYGSSVGNLLFQNADAFTLYNIKQSIEECVKTFESRVDLLLVEPKFEDYGLSINITYRVRNTNFTSSMTTKIKKA